MNAITRCKPLLGTMVSMRVSAALPRAALLEASQHAFLEIEKVHQALNFHAPDSELSVLNACKPGVWHIASTSMIQVLQCALSISAHSAGVFDVCANAAVDEAGKTIAASWQDIELDVMEQRLRLHRPATLDFGGIAKGYAVDCAAAVLQRTLSANVGAQRSGPEPIAPYFSINAGGDLWLSDWRNQTAEVRLPPNFDT